MLKQLLLLYTISKTASTVRFMYDEASVSTTQCLGLAIFLSHTIQSTKAGMPLAACTTGSLITSLNAMDAQMPCLQILEYKEFWQPQAEITLFDVCIIDIDVQSHVQHSVVLYCLWQNKQRNMQEQLKHVFTPFISIC